MKRPEYMKDMKLHWREDLIEAMEEDTYLFRDCMTDFQIQAIKDILEDSLEV